MGTDKSAGTASPTASAAHNATDGNAVGLSGLSGKNFGGYRIGEIITGGAHSALFAAEHTQSGDKVALKIFATDLSKDKNLAPRLVADLQKTCGVTHPNLLSPREIATADFKGKRLLFIATERLDGETLQARVPSGKGRPALPLHRALHIASEIGAALHAIHRSGNVHRQVTAASVFLARPQPGSRQIDEKVYLLDLGAALVPTADGQKATKGGKIQDDIRGLAQLVSEMLGGASEGAANSQAVLPLRQGARSGARKVPARLDAVLRSALGDTLGGGDKSGRFESVAAFMAALLGTGDTLPAIYSWSEDGRARPRPRPSGNRTVLWAAVLAITVGAGVGYLWYAQEPTPVRPLPTGPQTSPQNPPTSPTPVIIPGTAIGPGAPTNAAPDGGASVLVRPAPWPLRPGVPPLRDADPGAPLQPGAPAANTTAKPPGTTTPTTAPNPAANPLGTSTAPNTAAKPPGTTTPTTAPNTAAKPPGTPTAPTAPNPAAKPPGPAGAATTPPTAPRPPASAAAGSPQTGVTRAPATPGAAPADKPHEQPRPGPVAAPPGSTAPKEVK